MLRICNSAHGVRVTRGLCFPHRTGWPPRLVTLCHDLFVSRSSSMSSKTTKTLQETTRLPPKAQRSYATENGLPTTMHSSSRSESVFEADDNSGRWAVWRSGQGNFMDSVKIEVPRIWLRDHCQCAECLHPETKQRQIETFSKSLNTDIQLVLGLVEGSDDFLIQWGDGHISRYDTAWLHRAFASPSPASEDPIYKPVWWDGLNFHHQVPRVSYESVADADDSGLKEWISQIGSYGFAVVSDAPTDPKATELLLSRVGPIRNTHYGAFYDFTSDLSSKDTAYTSMELSVHNDTTYLRDPAGLQAFHVLAHTEGSGGITRLVDGFRAAEELRRRNPRAYTTLMQTNVTAHSSGNEGVSIISEPFPVLQSRPDGNGLECVRWNNDDRAAFPLASGEQTQRIEDWYNAASTWNEILAERNPSWWIEFALKPGLILLFDNWRILHGRTSFTGKRRMCGAYISRDDYLSRLRLSKLGREDILRDRIY